MRTQTAFAAKRQQQLLPQQHRASSASSSPLQCLVCSSTSSSSISGNYSSPRHSRAYTSSSTFSSPRRKSLSHRQEQQQQQQQQQSPRYHTFPSRQIHAQHRVRRVRKAIGQQQQAQQRWIQISTTPSSTLTAPGSVDIDVPDSNNIGTLDPPSGSSSSSSSSIAQAPDARFEVLGQPTASLLSISLSASQDLYTRRGTLVGLAGSPENTISRLSPLSPITRAPLGIPFLYQRVASASPVNILVAPKGTSHTTLSVLHLDGRLDWMVAQRNGLVAWTGRTIHVKPVINTKMTLANWGNSLLTGRGLAALAGKGQLFQLTLRRGEQYVVHPSHILAYTITPTPPQPYRFKSAGAYRLQVPSLTSWFPEYEFVRNVRASAVYKWLAQALFTLRTWTRRTIWADRLFLQFHGPATILLQSRGSSIRDALSNRDVNEIADAPAGAALTAAQGGSGTGVAAATASGGACSSSGSGSGTKSAAGGTGAVIPGPNRG